MFRCSVGQMTIHRPFACPVVALAVFVSLWRRASLAAGAFLADRREP